MKLVLIWIGKINNPHVDALVNIYADRITHYMPFEVITIPDIKNTKNMPMNELREKEGELILKRLQNGDYIILLDDKGRQYTSTAFSEKLESLSLSSCKRLVFVIGGAFGFSRKVYGIANEFLSLSKMTFSHQIIRPIFMEQLYRAMTIIRHEPYHHDESLFA